MGLSRGRQAKLELHEPLPRFRTMPRKPRNLNSSTAILSFCRCPSNTRMEKAVSNTTFQGCPTTYGIEHQILSETQKDIDYYFMSSMCGLELG